MHYLTTTLVALGLLTLGLAGSAAAAFTETCTDVDPLGTIQKCDYEGTYNPTRCGQPATGSFEGSYLWVPALGTYIVDAGQGSESQPASGYSTQGIYAGDGLGLTYVEVFAYQNNCGHGNGAAVVAFAGVAGALVHVNDREIIVVRPFLPI